VIGEQAVAPYIRRIAEVHPDLRVSSARLIDGHGQNNTVLIVNGDLVFRFPRYADGVRRLEAEAALLSRVQPRLPLPVPDPRYSSFERREVGQAFMGYRRIPGDPLWMETLGAINDGGALRAIGQQLGAFLQRLHGLPLGELLPDHPVAFDPLARWAELYARLQRHLFGHMRPDARRESERRFEAFLGDPRHRGIAPTLVHGDFGTGNILHDPVARRITGVIDFSEAGADDPAVDLAAVLWGPEDFVAGIAGAYPGIDPMRERMRFYARTFALQEALFGAEQGDAEAFRRGLAPYV
jgi:aminoglycoside 2''-phosphotransferase